MKEELNGNSFVDFRKVTESVNGKLSLIECSVLKHDNSLQTTLLKIVHLVADWPDTPSIFAHKNHPKLVEFVMFNTKQQNTKNFIQSAINSVLEFHSEQTMKETIVLNRSQIPNQLYVSNSGNRVSFWLEQETVSFLMGFERIQKLLKEFSWISEKECKSVNNEIEYGSENFVNLVEMFSLDCQMKLLSMVDYGGFEFRQVEEALHAVTSMLNYNYRFFFPPKDATRFLKKTSGITLSCSKELKEKRSSKWAQCLFLDSLFELRPTKCLARILADPSGPIYLEKYLFSDLFYAQIEQVYFLGQIQDYFNPKNIRNPSKNLTFLSRVHPEILLTVQAKQQITQFKADGRLQQTVDMFNEQQQLPESDEDSDDDQSATINPQSTNQHDKTITELFKNSEETIIQKIKQQLCARHNQTRHQQSQMQQDISAYEQQIVHTVVEIDQLTNSCQAGNISFCNACEFSNSKIGTSQSSLLEFISFFNYGNDSFCQSCSDLSVKERLITQKMRELQENHRRVQKIEAIKLAQEQALVQREMQMIEKNGNSNYSKCQHNSNTEQTDQKKQDKTEILKRTSNQPTISDIPQLTEKNQFPASTQEKTDQQKFQQFIGELMGQNNIEQDVENVNKKQQIHQRLLSAHENLCSKAEEQRNFYFQQKNSVFQRPLLLAEKYSLTWYLMILRLKNQSNQFISADYFHDSFELSLVAVQLTSAQYLYNELLDVYEYYFNRMLNYIMKTNQGNETELVSIPSILENVRTLKQLKYQQVQGNVFENVLAKSIKTDSKQQKYLSVQSQREQLTSKLYLFTDQKLQIYTASVAQHYRTYKQQMNAQYKVTQFQLKDMIAKFQLQLKDQILKTTQHYLFSIRWLLLLITEYIQVKTNKLRNYAVKFEEDNGIAFFSNELQLMLNLLATFIHVFNQPGQTKLIEQAQLEVVNCLILILQNEKSLKEKLNLQFDAEVIENLLQDMLDHFLSKISCDIKQDAKKLTSKHWQKFKPSFYLKLKSLRIQRLFACHEQFKAYQFKIAESCLLSQSKREITLSRHLRQDDQLNGRPGYFSSLLFLNQHFEKHQRTYYHNFEIWALMTLLGSVTRKFLKRDNLVMASKSEPQHRVKIGVVYKLILETLQKSECAQELINVYRSGNKLLLQLTSYLISQSYSITVNSTLNLEIAQKIKLFVERIRYRYIRNTPQTIQFHSETVEILDFLFKNRHSFFDAQRAQAFESQFHMIIQIVALNTLPLFNIEIAYKTQLKEIGKALRHFDVNDGYNTIEDYYLVVLNFRHNKSKEKRKKEIEAKKDKNEGEK